MNDYDRVARIINYLDKHHVEQPDLAALARYVGLSRFHFHRMFSKWAGVTPKDFLQCLTLSHAKDLLRKGQSVLEAAVNSGLSGPGRLHDLCIHLEAATPGEMKSGGEALQISYGFAQTPFGSWLAATSERGVCHLAFVDLGDSAGAIASLRAMWPKARLIWDDAKARQLTLRIFAKSQDSFQSGALNAFVRGTPFQIRVWRALLQTAQGTLVSYGSLASALGAPNASRAVGNAMVANSLAFLIPCHRVIRETGIIGNYRWGSTRKRSILAWESAASAHRSLHTNAA